MTRLIDADELKEYIDAQKGRPFIGCTIGEALKIMTDEQPTVEAIPVRHGEWKKIRGAINCSACKSSSWSMSFEGLVTSFNYCPQCGAYMRGDKHETD